MAVLNILQPLLLGRFVESFSNEGQSLKYLIIFMGTFFSWNVIYAIRDYFADKVTIKQLHQHSRIEYLEKLMDADYGYHMNKSSGELISLSDRALTVFFELYWGLNLWIFQIIIEFAVASYYLFTVDLIMGALMVGAIILSLLVTLPVVKRNVKFNKEVNDRDDEVKAVIADNLSCFETVKLFGQENFERKRLRSLFKKWEKAKMRYAITFRQIDIAVYSITFLSSAIMMYLAYKKVISGLWGIGLLITVFGYISSLNWKSFELIYKYRRFLKLNADIKKFMNIMELESTIKDGENSLKDVQGDICFDKVTFSYKGKKGKKDNEVLHSISLAIKPDETVAFVGKSGSGKTTLTKLLMRFYDPQCGNIYIDGKNLKDVKLEDLRKSVGIVPQDPVLFNETIGFNIAYGKPDASLEEITEATRKASLDKFIDTLPKKYDTVVGERGIKLSGGQRQRLAIARAILYNPEIIVFDEATSQLDSENERQIQMALDNLKKKKTTIIIAHRLSTVMKADRIIVFDEGRIVEEGKHEELMSNNGIYARLWELQTDFFN
jgi:ATP-binding cassette subfamily B protein